MLRRVIFLRHGESEWNRENKFTGWTDVELNETGIGEAKSAARLIHESKLSFDLVFTSVLTRAIRTAWIVQDELKRLWVPMEKDWHLNERNYGELQGLNKAQTTKKYGAEQVYKWRRSYTEKPPLLGQADDRHPRFDARYNDVGRQQLPNGESLKDVVNRVSPYWHKQILPAIAEGRHVLIVAHGNSLRALVKYLDHIAEDAIAEVNIPTGIPFVYDLNDDLKPSTPFYFLGDPEEARRRAEEVANQAARP